MANNIVDGAYLDTDKKFDINDFRSSINDYHKTAHFNMILSIPQGLRGDLESYMGEDINVLDVVAGLVFNIEATELPGVSIATDEVRRYGVGNFERKPYVTTFKELDITVRSDAAGSIYKFFQSWMKLIINFDGRYGRNGITGFRGASVYEVAYKATYATRATVATYDGAGDENLRINFNNIYPIYLSPTSLNWSDNNIVKFQVKFSYSEWNMDSNLFVNPPGNGPR